MVRKLILGVVLAIIVLVASSLIVGAMISYSTMRAAYRADSAYLASPSPLAGFFSLIVPESQVMDQKVEAIPPTKATQGYLDVVGRMVVYTAELSLEAEKPNSIILQVRGIAESMGGFVERAQVLESEAVIMIRVPQQGFFEALERIRNLGKVTSERISGEDVTERYVDLRAHLENLRKTEARLLEILEVARTVDEILKVEAELSRVRGEIERVTGQLQFLERRVELSTIAVYVRKPAKPPEPEFPRFDMMTPLIIGLTGLYTVLSAIVVMAISAMPIAAIAVPAYYGYRHFRKSSPSK